MIFSKTFPQIDKSDFKLIMKIGYKFKYVKVIAFPKIKSKAN